MQHEGHKPVRHTRTCQMKGGAERRVDREQGSRWSSAGVIRVGRFCSKGQKFRVRQSEQVTLATMWQSVTCSPHCLNRLKLRFLEHRASWEMRSKHHHPPPQTSTPWTPSPHPAKVNTYAMSKHIHNAPTLTYVSIRQTLEYTIKPETPAFIMQAQAHTELLQEGK